MDADLCVFGAQNVRSDVVGMPEVPASTGGASGGAAGTRAAPATAGTGMHAVAGGGGTFAAAATSADCGASASFDCLRARRHERQRDPPLLQLSRGLPQFLRPHAARRS